jgi:hypothetical protein
MIFLFALPAERLEYPSELFRSQSVRQDLDGILLGKGRGATTLNNALETQKTNYGGANL